MDHTERTFEDGIERLERIVTALDSGRLSLDASLELFTEGAELIRFCNTSLEEAELRLEELFPGLTEKS